MLLKLSVQLKSWFAADSSKAQLMTATHLVYFFRIRGGFAQGALKNKKEKEN